MKGWTSLLPGRLKERPLVKSILANSGWLIAGRCFNMALQVGVGIWVARYLGPEKLGVLAFALALISLARPLAGLGLGGILPRNLVQEPARCDEFMGSSFSLRALAGILCLPLVVGAAFLLRPEDEAMPWLVAVVAVSLALRPFDVVEKFFQSEVQSKHAVVAKSTGYTLASCFRVGMILTGAPLICFAWAVPVEMVLMSLGLIVAYLLYGRSPLAWRFSTRAAREMLRDGWPLVFSGLVIMVYARIDQVMLAEMATDREVGFYAIAVRITEMWVFVPGAIVASSLAGIVEAKKTSEALFYERLQKLYNTVTFLGYAVAIPLTVAGPWLVPLVFGREYAEAGPMLSVLAWSSLLTGLGIARSSFLRTMNWTKVHLFTVMLGGAANLSLNWLLIPHYGGMGAAVATLASYWLAAHGSCFFYKPLHRTGMMLTKSLLWPKVW